MRSHGGVAQVFIPSGYVRHGFINRGGALRAVFLEHESLHIGVKMARIASQTKYFCSWDGETLVLNVLGTPSAKKDAIGKPKGSQLKISVTATPVGGKATDHMVRFLACEFGVTPKDIEVVFGRFNVNKQLRIKSPKSFPSVVSKELSRQEEGG